MHFHTVNKKLIVHVNKLIGSFGNNFENLCLTCSIQPLKCHFSVAADFRVQFVDNIVLFVHSCLNISYSDSLNMILREGRELFM